MIALSEKLKSILADLSQDEKNRLFYELACEVRKLDDSEDDDALNDIYADVENVIESIDNYTAIPLF
jgi:hypothetical protein